MSYPINPETPAGDEIADVGGSVNVSVDAPNSVRSSVDQHQSVFKERFGNTQGNRTPEQVCSDHALSRRRRSSRATPSSSPSWAEEIWKAMDLLQDQYISEDALASQCGVGPVEQCLADNLEHTNSALRPIFSAAASIEEWLDGVHVVPNRLMQSSSSSTVANGGAGKRNPSVRATMARMPRAQPALSAKVSEHDDSTPLRCDEIDGRSNVAERSTPASPPSVRE